MFSDRSLEVLLEDDCLDLLRSMSVGRIGLSMGALPVVLPVNYVVDSGRIIIRTGFGTKLSAAIRIAVVCFEVDRIDPDLETGWSVLVTGTARELQGAEATHAATLPLRPWSPQVGDHLVAIGIELISGRSITAERLVMPVSI
jgi:nitroimidazol reductase NimA-like FMN-containing flavoprotein (pyridoxamine 5'-phosphate oxidase superfamily)